MLFASLAFGVPLVLTGALASFFPDVSSTLQNILKNTDRSDRYSYPTDFTRGIIPKPFHSHNDYWRDVPFYTALSYGAMSVEADVWLVNGTLFVGHHPSSLTPQRTLESLYITPILETLRAQNPSTPFVDHATKYGVFDADPGQTLYFFIDVKTSPLETWSAVLSALEPLKKGDWLSSSSDSSFTRRAVTVVGTGNTPLSAVQNANPRFAFFDAPLPLLSSTFDNITRFDSPIASTNFEASFGDVRATMNDTQVEKLREQVAEAHGKGIMVRYWNQPNFPVGTRNGVWKQLWEEGVDFLNADDVRGVAGFWET